MHAERFFCSQASRSHAESLYGTVARVRTWILLEYPSVWRHRAVKDSRLLSDSVRKYLEGAADRALLIRQGHRRTGDIRCFRIDCVAGTASVFSVGDYEELPATSLEPQPVSGLLYATCTHARHDMCCAKFGLPVACAIRDEVGERAWDCSHVGGDRFAGNVVVFPHGLYYGHVSPEEVPDLIRTSERGDVWLKGYRGRCTHSRNVQIADYFARRESGRLAIDEFRPIEANRGYVRFRATTDGSVHEVEYRIRPEPIHERLTCLAEQPADIPQYELIRYSCRK